MTTITDTISDNGKVAVPQAGSGIDLRVSYLGLSLPHPFMPGASPLADDLETVRELEDAGAAAIVMRSLFEEQLIGEQIATHATLDATAESFGEALSYFPDREEYRLGPEEYLEHLLRIKSAVEVPVIASLNGTTPGGWLEYAGLIEEAGADALELNVYDLATDPAESGSRIEERILNMVRDVKAAIGIPVAVKLSPFITSLAHLAQQLDAAGADGVILFNRFYQADIDIEELMLERILLLSDSAELLLRLRWIAILFGRIEASLAVTGGIHSATDAIKAVMSGAHVVQSVSALLHHGPGYLETLRTDFVRWMEEHEYESLEQMRGSMSLRSCPDPHAYERVNYIQILQTRRM